MLVHEKRNLIHVRDVIVVGVAGSVNNGVM